MYYINVMVSTVLWPSVSCDGYNSVELIILLRVIMLSVVAPLKQLLDILRRFYWTATVAKLVELSITEQLIDAFVGVHNLFN